MTPPTWAWLTGRVQTQPDRVHNPMLQHERTALAWERTAIAAIVTGLLFVRAAAAWHPVLTLVGFAQVVFGGGLLIWAGYHYDELHGPLRAGESPVRPTATRVVGVVVTAFTGGATVVYIAAIGLGL